MSHEGQMPARDPGPVVLDHETVLAVLALRELVDEQAEDMGLWVEAVTAAEAYVQAALRRLHAAVEEVVGP